MIEHAKVGSTSHRTFLQRLFGLSATPEPRDTSSWTLSGAHLLIDLTKLPELSEQGGAVRLEGGGLATRVLLFRGQDDLVHAVRNMCPHGHRRIDLLPQEGVLQCCSVGRSTFTCDGHLLSGASQHDLTMLPVIRTDTHLLVEMTAVPVTESAGIEASRSMSGKAASDGQADYKRN